MDLEDRRIEACNALRDWLKQNLNFTDYKKPVNTVDEFKNKNMKKIFKTFEFKGRKITLCVKTQDKNPLNGLYITSVGYAVCNPKDEYNEELAKKISEGRANSMKTNLTNQLTERIHVGDFLNHKVILYSIAKLVEAKLRKGELKIKGIPNDK